MVFFVLTLLSLVSGYALTISMIRGHRKGVKVDVDLYYGLTHKDELTYLAVSFVFLALSLTCLLLYGVAFSVLVMVWGIFR